jgi:hypothetical protein
LKVDEIDNDELLAGAARVFCTHEKADLLVINGECFPPLEDAIRKTLRTRCASTNKPKRLFFLVTTPGGLQRLRSEFLGACKTPMSTQPLLWAAGAKALELFV